MEVLQMRINSRKAFSIILLSLSLCACSNNGTKNNIQERRHKSPSDFTQIHSAPTNETSILETSTKREAEIFIDEEFCKNLLRRLVTDDIHIKEGDDEYYFSERFSPEYMEKLKDSKFYINQISDGRHIEMG